MNCREALSHLYDVIDKEADEINAREVEKHLKMCRHCMARYEFERALKAFVIDKGKDTADASMVKANIRGLLDGIDARQKTEKANGQSFRWLPVILATAAAVIICLGAVLLSSWFRGTLTRTSQESIPAAADTSMPGGLNFFISAHLVHASQPGPQNGGRDPLQYLYERTGIFLGPIPADIAERIHSVSVDTLMKIPFGCLELDDANGEPITIFVTTSDRYTLPDQPLAMINGREMVVHRCEKCTLVGLEKKDLIFLVVSRPGYEATRLVELASFF